MANSPRQSFNVVRLEDRALPSGLAEPTALSAWLPPSTADLSTVSGVLTRDGTRELTYTAESKTFGLAIRPDRVAIGLATPSDDEVARLTAGDGPLAGMTFVRWLSGGIAVLEGASTVPTTDGITFTVPVFANGGSGRDAIVIDEVIVALDPETDPELFFANDRFAGYRSLDGTTDQFVATLKIRGVEAVGVANALRNDPRVVWSEPNFHQDWQKFFVPNDSYFTNGNLWHIQNTGQGTGGVPDADTDLDLAWDLNPGGSSNRIIGIVDDGIEAHPDLDLWVNPGEIPGDGKDNDGNGYIDDVNGWNFVNNNNSAGPTYAADRHGTAVAGLTAAKGNNGIGVIGGSFNARVLSSRIFENNVVASDANIAAAVYYASGRNKNGIGNFTSVDVMNNSWGGGGYSSAITAAFNSATTKGRGGLGTVTLVASGNDTRSAMSYPALLAATNLGLISVGGSNNQDIRANYANFGSYLSLVAPTCDTRNTDYLWISTTDRIGSIGYAGEDYTGNHYTNGFGGTSAATPIAAGIAGLVISQAENKGLSLTAADVRALLMNSTDLIGNQIYEPENGNALEYGRGRINAFSAVSGVGKPELSVLSAKAELANAAAVNLGNATINASTTQTFRIRNAGTSDLNLSTISVTGSGFYLDAGPGSNVLKLGEATTITIRFAPTAAGTAAGLVSITSNDADEAGFTFSLTATGVAGNVTGHVYEDWNGNGSRDANDPGIAGRSVFLDTNANGILDRSSFSSDASNSNLPIPDNAVSGVSSIITVSGQTLPVSRVTVKLNVTHTADYDLNLWLISPSGTSIWLASAIGDNGDNYTNTVFDDSAANAIETGIAPFTGTYRPQIGHLSQLDGETANGNWTLRCADSESGDSGTFLNWTLSFDSEPTAVTDSQGLFGFRNLANGGYTVHSTAPTGWTATSGVSGTPIVIAAPGDNFAGIDFGSAKNNRAYLRVRDDANANGSFEITETGVAGRTLYRDTNDNAALDLAGTPPTFTKTANIAIPDKTIFNPNVTSSLTVSGVTGSLLDVDVTVNITHPVVSNLKLTLTSPAGTNIVLVNAQGSSGVNFTGTVFDDSAIVSIKNITSVQSPYTAQYIPENPLSVLIGQTPNGTWKLKAQDLTLGDAGTLDSWSVTLTTAVSEPVAVTDASGNAFLDLPTGTSRVRLIPVAGFKSTNPATSLISLTAAGVPLFEQTFGTAEAVAPTVLSLVVNDGAPQRSMIASVRLDFSEHVYFSGAVADAFTVTGTSGPVAFTASVDDSGMGTRVTVSFASLADGHYTVTPVMAQITDAALNSLATPGTLAFARLFGDVDGNGTVNGQDFAIFGTVFGSSDAVDPRVIAFDYNGDHTISSIDFAEFGLRFGSTV